jgi:hypothetical protein
MVMEPLIFHKHLCLGSQWDYRKWKLRTTPTLETMLKRCHVTGVPLLEVIEDPRSAAHRVGEFEFVRHNLTAKVRPRRPIELAGVIRQTLVEQLARPESEALPSFAGLARILEVTTGYIRYREPVLVAQYCNRVRLQNLNKNRALRTAVAQWLRSRQMQDVFEQLGCSQKRLVSYVAITFDVGVRLARGAVHSALLCRERGPGHMDKASKQPKRRNWKRPYRVTRERIAILAVLESAGGSMYLDALRRAIDRKANASCVSLDRLGLIQRHMRYKRPTLVSITEIGRNVLSEHRHRF